MPTALFVRQTLHASRRDKEEEDEEERDSEDEANEEDVDGAGEAEHIGEENLNVLFGDCLSIALKNRKIFRIRQ
jgi:hypothetical protein